MIAVDTPAWWSWLENATSFTFKNEEGSFTAHKTRASNGRGGWYWYAYRRQHGRLSNLYLGTSEKLTLRRLREAAHTLSGNSAAIEMPASPAIAPDPASTSAPGNDRLLVMKQRPPRLSMQHVSRPRLLTLLKQSALRSLTLVAAPAGSGKTTLLAEWAATSDFLLAWISLETTDNDPSRFLAYLLAALASLDARIDPTAYQAADAQDPESALTGILNELTSSLQQDAVVILDDYHLLTAEMIHALLRFLLDHLPPHLHLIIGTRVDPPLPLARLRARGQLSEIRAEDLRFVPDEVEALVSSMGLALSTEATNLLETRAEGWITGIQLLALALRGQADAVAFLSAFRGTHRFLLDYVGEEVLAQQTPETQRFLLRTCALEQMTGPLCEALTDLPDGQIRLANLLRANLFVNALDDGEIWYRYHPLFAETLRTHLQKREPALLPELYLRASRWYEQQQRGEEACEYAFLAGDFHRAANLLAEILPQLIDQGRFEQLGRWLSQLPPDLIAESPQLYITMPWMQSLGQHAPDSFAQAIESMQQRMQEQQQDEDVSWTEPQSVLAFFQALTALSHNRLPQAFLYVRKALRALTRRDTALSQLLSRFLQIFLSITYGASGNLAAAEQALLKISATQTAEPFSMTSLAAPFLLAELYKAQGQLRKIGSLYERLFRAFDAHANLSPAPLLLMSFSLMRRATLLYEWNHLWEASKEMQRVQEILPHAMQGIIPRTSRSPLFAFGLWVQARIELAQGRPEAAWQLLALLRDQPEIAGELPPGKERPLVDIPTLAARLALTCGQMEEAVNWANTCEIHFDDAPVTLLESRQVFAYLTLARILIARGRNQRAEADLSQALILLDHWRDCALHLGFQGWLIEIQMLTALALQAQGNTARALTMLGSALALAEPEGYMRLFADEGQPMACLLAQISAYTTASPGYIQRLQAALPSTRPALLVPAQPATPQLLIDPLSAREQEVLTLLASGLSNQQIADHLVISLNTAKRHVKHILAKLAASNRTQAVARARELQLL